MDAGAHQPSMQNNRSRVLQGAEGIWKEARLGVMGYEADIAALERDVMRHSDRMERIQRKAYYGERCYRAT